MKNITVNAIARNAKVDPTAMPTIDPELTDFSWPVGGSTAGVAFDETIVLLGVAVVVAVEEILWTADAVLLGVIDGSSPGTTRVAIVLVVATCVVSDPRSSLRHRTSKAGTERM